MPAKKTNKKTTTTKKATTQTATETKQETTAQTQTQETTTTTTVTATPSDTVTVLLNYPSDLIFKATDNKGVEHEIVIKGNARDLIDSANGREIVLPVGKYGITRGVNREAWEAVKKEYSQMPMFQNKIIFELGSKEDAEKIAEEYRSIRNGFEPIDPATLSEDFYKQGK